ncbi:MAG: F0F1 ATP synthase subunit A [Tissierellia bacterium]|nr:F0F1 ATP synthase subunit A [Tissierellia bacterium]
MKKIKVNKRGVGLLLVLIGLFFILSLVAPRSSGPHQDIGTLMKDAVLHEDFKIGLLGLEVNPAVVSGFIVTLLILLGALGLRLFLIPKFKFVPSGGQLVLEEALGLFEGMAREKSPHRHGFLSVYLFCVGTYVFLGTLFELLGLQALSTGGASVTLPAPLADINGALSLGILSFLVIVSGAIKEHGVRGLGKVLSEFSLPISMSFRLFGALVSGLLVTEMVYHYVFLGYLVPVLVALVFTLLHALIQTYVLTTLTAVFYGKVSQPKLARTPGKKA